MFATFVVVSHRLIQERATAKGLTVPGGFGRRERDDPRPIPKHYGRRARFLVNLFDRVRDRRVENDRGELVQQFFGRVLAGLCCVGDALVFPKRERAPHHQRAQKGGFPALAGDRENYLAVGEPSAVGEFQRRVRDEALPREERLPE